MSEHLTQDKHNQRVLIVEDSPTQAEALRRVLATAGYEVIVAQDG